MKIGRAFRPCPMGPLALSGSAESVASWWQAIGDDVTAEILQGSVSGFRNARLVRVVSVNHFVVSRIGGEHGYEVMAFPAAANGQVLSFSEVASSVGPKATIQDVISKLGAL